jgi:hypothetical protein
LLNSDWGFGKQHRSSKKAVSKILSTGKKRLLSVYHLFGQFLPAGHLLMPGGD